MEIRQLQKKVYDIAVSKGWYDPEVKQSTDVERHMLMVSEIAEATEEVRNNQPAFRLEGVNPEGSMDSDILTYVADSVTQADIAKVQQQLPKGKPEGEAAELADAVIRIMDYFESKGWDLEAVVLAKSAYNETRPYRHGGKKI